MLYEHYRRDYLEGLLRQAKDLGLFDDLEDFADFLLENGVTLDPELED